MRKNSSLKILLFLKILEIVDILFFLCVFLQLPHLCQLYELRFVPKFHRSYKLATINFIFKRFPVFDKYVHIFYFSSSSH